MTDHTSQAAAKPVARELAPAGLRSSPKPDTSVCQMNGVAVFRAASRPSGSKLPRHDFVVGQQFEVGPQAAIASKLAPTNGSGYGRRNRSAIRPPSRASPLPQMDQGMAGETGRLSGRLREQARSHKWIRVWPEKQVGYQAAFASKPAPTNGSGYGRRNRSAIRPPSRASPLPQMDQGMAGETGRLLGRLREQARSHRGNAIPPRTRSAIRPPRDGR